LKLVLNVTSKHASINVELDEHALNRLNDAVPGALLTVWPLVQQVVRVVQEKQQTENDEEDSDEEAEPIVGRRWMVIGQNEKQGWLRLSMPCKEMADAESLLANEQFRKDAATKVNTLRLVTEDEWTVCFDPQFAPPGIAAVLSEIFFEPERPIWMVVQWFRDRWVPRAISYDLGTMQREQMYLDSQPEASPSAVCTYQSWLGSFRERDSVYLAQDDRVDGERPIWWDAVQLKWDFQQNGHENRGVTEQSWRECYHNGYANPPYNYRPRDWA